MNSMILIIQKDIVSSRGEIPILRRKHYLQSEETSTTQGYPRGRVVKIANP